MLKPVYDQLKDKNIATYVVYAKAADSKLYKEAAFTNQVEEAELKDAFMKGRLLVDLGTSAGLAAVVLVKANKATTLVVGAQDAVTGKEWAAKAAA